MKRYAFGIAAGLLGACIAAAQHTAPPAKPSGGGGGADVNDRSYSDFEEGVDDDGAYDELAEGADLERAFSEFAEGSEFGSADSGTDLASESADDLAQRYKRLNRQTAETARQVRARRKLQSESEQRAQKAAEAYSDVQRQSLLGNVSEGKVEKAAEAYRDTRQFFQSTLPSGEQLRREVAAAFMARQQMQRAKVARLRQELDAVQRSIDAREKIKGQIIDRRVQELLQPELRWDDGGQSSRDGAPPAAASGEDGPRSEWEKLAGAWDIVGLEMPDRSTGGDTARGERGWIEISGNRFVSHLFAGGFEAELLLLDSPGPIKKLNLVIHRGQKSDELRGIYSLEGDMLTLCLPDHSGLDRPARLAAGGESHATLLTLKRSSTAHLESAQVEVREPEGMIVIWRVDDRNWQATSRVDLFYAPGYVPVPLGGSALLKLENLRPGELEPSLSGTIHAPPENERTAAFLRYNAIPLDITEADIQRAAGGELVTKVIYVQQLDAGSGESIQVLTNQDLPAGVDPLREARQRGDVLATVQIGNRTSTLGAREDWHLRFLERSLAAEQGNRESLLEQITLCELHLAQPSPAPVIPESADDATREKSVADWEKRLAPARAKLAELKRELQASDQRITLLRARIAEHQEAQAGDVAPAVSGAGASHDR